MYGIPYGAAEAPPLNPFEVADAESCEADFMQFIKRGWRYVEPLAFQSNWHLDAIADHLTAAVDQQIKRGLVVNLPPRHGKSLGTNVFLPAWVWAQNPIDQKRADEEPHGLAIRPGTWRGPGTKFMYLSYAGDLSRRDSIKCRNVMRSNWYRRLWTDQAPKDQKRFNFRVQSDNIARFDNDQGGHRIATSETGLITGEGGDIIIFDDPHNVRQTESDKIRESTLQFWDESMPTRLNDPDRGVFIIVMQRVHERDLTGHILSKEMGWTHLCLPAEYERRHPYPIKTTVRRSSGPQEGKIWKDERTREGEPLWPDRFSNAALKMWSKEMGTHAAAGQLQQRPTARQGGVFKREWFEVVAAAPVSAQYHRVRSWDLAGTKEQKHDPDYTVGLRMCRDATTGILYIDSLVRDRWSPAEVERAILNCAHTDGYGTVIRIPQDPGQAGRFQARHLVTQLPGYRIMVEAETTSKENRADVLAAQCEVGNVKLVRGPWNDAFIDEMCAFNRGSHDDQVDAASAAFRALFSNPNVPLQGRYTDR